MPTSHIEEVMGWDGDEPNGELVALFCRGHVDLTEFRVQAAVYYDRYTHGFSDLDVDSEHAPARHEYWRQVPCSCGARYWEAKKDHRGAFPVTCIDIVAWER